MKVFGYFLGGTLLGDALTKYLTVHLLGADRSFSIIGTFLQFTYVQNRGAAFGILPGKQTFLISVSIFVAAFIIWFLYKERPRDLVTQAALGLLLGGTLGNLYNRIFQGYVVDFIDFNFWPTFNIADIAINCGVLILVVQLLRSEYQARPMIKRKRG